MSGFDPVGDRPVADPSSGPTLLTITGTPVTLMTVGLPYSFQLTASGGTGPYTWALTIGTLPPGLTLDTSTGIVSGYPTAVGSYGPLNFRATDSLSVIGDLTPQPIIAVNVHTLPAPLLTKEAFGPHNYNVRTKYGYGVPPGSAQARISWIGVEVLYVGNPFARISWIGVEVLRSVDRPPPFFKEKRPWTMKRKHRRPVYTTKRLLSFVPVASAAVSPTPHPKPYWMHQRPKHRRPHYTVKAKLNWIPLPPPIPFRKHLAPWQRGYEVRHHAPHYTVVRTAIVQPPLKMIPPHRKRKPWEMKRKHTNPRYTTVKHYPWRPAPVGISALTREVLRSSNGKNQVGQTLREVLHSISPKVGISQVVREILGLVLPQVRITRSIREVLEKRYSSMRVTQTPREVLHNSHAKMRVTKVTREILRSREPFPRPDQMSNASDSPMVATFRFGDGYTQRAGLGTGNPRRKQTIEWVNLHQSQADRILYFLERMNGSYPFMWTPNGEKEARWFIAEAWKVKELSRGFTTIYECQLIEATKEQIHGYNYEPPWLPEAYN